jgi:integrase
LLRSAAPNRALPEGALRLGLAQRNVSELVDPPRMRHHEMTTLSEQQARALIDATRSMRHEALYVVALATGMRLGELLALKRRDIDLERATLNVRATLQRTSEGLILAAPKTAHNRRTIALSRTAVAAFRQHRARQLEERLGKGEAWHDMDLVFANEIGRPLEAGNVLRRSFWPLLKRAELPHMRFHDLRHTAATLLLGRGINPKVVAEMLGHSHISITLGLYSHVTPHMQQQAAAAMDGALGED